ncbi:MAG: hypothetical protein F6K11_10240 [Leptolyngbya sp. SIO3F4]|nr:hypothetical protein [Leptolyngbya sp. SIO3F4]
MRIEFSPWSHLLFGIGGFLLALWLTGCSSVEEPVLFYVATEAGEEYQKDLAANLLYEIERVAYSNDRVKLGYLAEEKVWISHNARFDKHETWDLAEGIETIESNDQAIIAALYSILDTVSQHPKDGRVQAVIVTDGTQDKEKLEAITGVSEKLAAFDNFHILIVGVPPKHRTDFAKGFEPIRDRALVLTSEAEISDDLRSYGER